MYKKLVKKHPTLVEMKTQYILKFLFCFFSIKARVYFLCLAGEINIPKKSTVHVQKEGNNSGYNTNLCMTVAEIVLRFASDTIMMINHSLV